VNVFIDTSVWSLALRRNQPAGPEVQALRRCLGGGDLVVTTGIVLQELLQGFQGPRARSLIIERLTRLPFIHPDVGDHIAAAELRNRCRRQGVQVGTIDALTGISSRSRRSPHWRCSAPEPHKRYASVTWLSHGSPMFTPKLGTNAAPQQPKAR
jgi:predicted nucleic acid-binding protein